MKKSNKKNVHITELGELFDKDKVEVNYEKLAKTWNV